MPFDVNRMLALGRVSSLAVSPDGTWVAVAVSTVDPEKAKFVSSLWRVPLDPKEEPERLTRGQSNDREPRFRHDGSLAFLSNRKRSESDGEPRDQVWAMPARGGEPVPLTDEPLGVSSFKVAKSNASLCVIANVLPSVAHEAQRAKAKELAEKGPSALRYRELPVRHWDHWVETAAPHAVFIDPSGARRDLTPEADREHRGDLEWDLAADGSRVALVTRKLAADRVPDSAIVVVETATGRSKTLGAAPQWMLDHPKLSPSGKTLVCTHNVRSRDGHGKISLAKVDIESGELRLLASDWELWPTPHAFAGESRVLVTADERGTCPVFSMDIYHDTVTRVTRASDGGAHGGVEPHGHEIFCIRHTALHPPEVFRCKLEPEQRLQQVTTLSGFSKEDAARATLSQMTVTSMDGTQVHGYVVRPKDVAKPKVVLWIHGGPVGAFGDQWHWRWNALVMASAGYAVALPNPRGSTGYGQAFVEGIWRNTWGGACFEDVMAFADALEKDPSLDGKHMAAMGGSFGGYMANWIGGQTTRFSALVTHASIFHMEAFAGGTDYGGWFQLEMNASPREDALALARYSPHAFVKNWKTPTLILHGERDYRVPIQEALVLFDALQELGVESELVVYPDENHWILKPRNIADWYGHVVRFLGEHLG